MAGNWKHQQWSGHYQTGWDWPNSWDDGQGQARREQIHKLTLDLKAEREKNSDLRKAQDTALKMLKIEMNQDFDKEREKWVPQVKA
eukprot:s9511_g3.t1